MSSSETAVTLKSGVPRLNAKNYEIWAVLFVALMTRMQLEEVAINGAPMPLTGPNSPAGKAWIRKNAQARAEMILHVEVDQLPHMSNTNAHQVWLELERVHRARGLATRMSLRRKFLTMRMKEDQLMSSWIAEVRNIAFQLEKINVTLDDEDLILVLTMGLPSSYDRFIITLDSTPPADLTLDYVINRLLNEESRQAVVVEPENVAMAATPDRRPKRSGLAHITCYGCGEKGHFRTTCPHKPSSSKSEEAHMGAESDSDDAF